MHILLIRFSSMGDVVLQTATINWLKSLMGDSLSITFVTASEFTSLLEGHPSLNLVIGYNRRQESWQSLIVKLKQLHADKPIDLILDLHATMRSWRLKLSLLSIPALTVDKRRWERFLLTKLKSVPLRRLFNLSAFGLEPQAERIIKDFEFIFQSGETYAKSKTLKLGPHQELTSLGPIENYPLPSPYVVLAPSASFHFKRWPVDNFVKLAQELLEKTSYHLVILAGPADNFCQAFAEIGSERLINLQGKTSLKESMSVLSQSSLCIGNDSGMNHIAEAYGVPCLTLFGPTDPRFGFAPHGKNSAYLSKDLWCKPCSTTGASACYRSRHFCMENISVKEVRTRALACLGVKQ